MTLTFTLTDLLLLTSIVCLIVFTIYLVLTLKSLSELFKQSTILVNESTVLVTEGTGLVAEGTKIVTDVQTKAKAVEAYVSSVAAKGKKVKSTLNVMNRLKK